MELILALILWVIIGSKMASEKSSEKRYRQSFEEHLYLSKSFVSRATSWDLENRPCPLSYSELNAEKDAALLEIFESPERAKTFEQRWRGFNKRGNLINIIYLANRGKIADYHAQYGIKCDIYARTDLTADQELEFAADCKKFMMWVDKKLKQHGVNEKLYIGNDQVMYYGYFFPVAEARANAGVYYKWGPAIQSAYIYKNEKEYCDHLMHEIQTRRGKKEQCFADAARRRLNSTNEDARKWSSRKKNNEKIDG